MTQSRDLLSTPPATTEAPARDIRRHRLFRQIGFLLILLGTIYCALSAWRFHGSYLFGADFRGVYGSSRCMAVGCDPYRGADTKREFLAHGGTLFEVGVPPESSFTDNFLDYPPTSLFYLMPFGILPWHVAWWSWLAIGMAVYTLACFQIADLCAIDSPLAANALVACFAMMINIALALANPALLASGLCCIAVLLLLQNRRPWIAVALFAFSLVLKPHLVAFVLLYFLVAGGQYRKRALQIVGVTIAFALPAILWASVRPSSHNWVRELSANLAGVSSRGQLSDPGPTNPKLVGIVDLRTVFALIHDDPAFYTHATYAVSICFLAAWLYAVVKLRPSRAKDLIAIAAITCFGLLPVYHRNSDTKLLLLVYPAIALLIHRSRGWGAAAGVVGFLLAFVSGRFIYSFGNKLPALAHLANDTIFRVTPSIVSDRPEPVLFLASALFFLAILYTMLARKPTFLGDPPA